MEYVWSEANGELRDVLAVSAETIKVEQLDKAEAALLSIKRILSDSTLDTSKRGVCCLSVVYYACVHLCVCVGGCIFFFSCQSLSLENQNRSTFFACVHEGKGGVTFLHG